MMFIDLRVLKNYVVGMLERFKIIVWKTLACSSVYVLTLQAVLFQCKTSFFGYVLYLYFAMYIYVMVIYNNYNIMYS